MPPGPRLAALGEALVSAPVPAASLGNTLPFKDQEDYKKNLGLIVDSYGAIFDFSGVDQQLQKAWLHSRVLRANLLVGQRVLEVGKARIKEKPLPLRDAAYVAECFSGVVRPISEQLALVCGLVRLTSIAASNVAAHGATSLAPMIKIMAMRPGANPRVPASQVEQLMQQSQRQAEDMRSCYRIASSALTLQRAADLDGFGAAASRVASGSCLAASVIALVHDMDPRCSMSDLLQDEAKRELELCAIMAAAFAALPDIRRLNDEYGFFARPAEPEHVLAPDMRRLIKDHIAAVRNLHTLRALSDRLGLAMSDSARQLLELLDELEPVLLPGWQVADPNDLLHGLTTAQIKGMRSQLERQQAVLLPGWQVADSNELLHGLTTAQFEAKRAPLDQQQAAALAAAADVREADAGVMAAQAPVAELGKSLAQRSKRQEEQMRLTQASMHSVCIAAADGAVEAARGAQAEAQQAVAKAQQAEAKAQQAEAKAQEAQAKAVETSREVELLKRKLHEMGEQTFPLPSGCTAPAAGGSAQSGRPLSERNGGGHFEAPATTAALTLATVLAAVDCGLGHNKAAVKMPVGQQAELAKRTLDAAEVAAEGRRALAGLRGREPSGEGHVDLLRAQADQLWTAQPQFAFNPGAAGAATAVPAAELRHSLLLGMQQALREFQTLTPRAEKGQPAALTRQGGVQALQVQLQPQRAPNPPVLPVLLAPLHARADVPSSAGLAAAIPLRGPSSAALTAAAAIPLRSEVADTTQWLAGINLSSEFGAALADGGID
ncbi:hypothetical protein ABPG77_001073 [Micractinium sp. CCAP 211/92]